MTKAIEQSQHLILCPLPHPASRLAWQGWAKNLAIITEHKQGVIDGSVDSLHDFRVAWREVRTVLECLSDVLPPGTSQLILDDAKWIRNQLGIVRDHDV